LKLAPEKQNTNESCGESVLKLRLQNIVIKSENGSKPLKTSVDMQLAGTKKLKLIAACAALTAHCIFSNILCYIAQHSW
jgi:hypothetical protein